MVVIDDIRIADQNQTDLYFRDLCCCPCGHETGAGDDKYSFRAARQHCQDCYARKIPRSIPIQKFSCAAVVFTPPISLYHSMHSVLLSYNDASCMMHQLDCFVHKI